MKKISLILLTLVPPILLLFLFFQIPNVPYQTNTVISGIFAYSFILNALYLSSKPKWIDRLIGLQNGYLIHIIMGTSAVLLALAHNLISSASNELTKRTGTAGFLLLVGIALFSTPFLNGYLKIIHSAFIKINQKFAKLLPRKTVQTIHRLNVLVVLLIFIHVSSMSFFREHLLFYFVFTGYTLLSVGSFIANKIREKGYLSQGVIVKKTKLNYNTTELVIALAPQKKNNTINPGDFVYLTFPKIKGMNELHPFSVVSVKESEGKLELIFAIRSDGDWTKQIETQVKETDTVLLDTSYGLIHRELMNAKYDDLCLIVGGNGITPVVTIIPTLLEKEKFKNIHLFWSVKQKEDWIYLEHFHQLENEYPNFHLKTQTNRFDMATITQSLEHPENCLMVILGSSVMVQATKKQLLKNGSLTQKQIVTEGFAI